MTIEMGPSRSQVVIFAATLLQDTHISNSHSEEVEIEDGKKINFELIIFFLIILLSFSVLCTFIIYVG